jgi:ATP-dependent DNA ligase
MGLSAEFFSFAPKKTSNGSVFPDDLNKFVAQQIKLDHWPTAERKWDGSFYIARFLPGGRVTFTSRRVGVSGKPVEKSANLPHLNHLGSNVLEGTMVLGEVIPPGGFRFNQCAGVMNSTAEHAAEWQRQNGYLHYVLFDCLWYNGMDIRQMTLRERQKYLRNVRDYWMEDLHVIESPGGTCVEISQVHQLWDKPKDYTEKLFHKIVKAGGEGLMIKNVDQAYAMGVYKCKKFVDASVVITEFQEGTGKYIGMLGALKISVYDPKTKKYVEIGKASGMDDDLRKEMWNNQKDWLGMVVDCRCQPPDDPEAYDPYTTRLRHPRYKRQRPDMAPTQCTVEKLVDDFRGIQKVH